MINTKVFGELKSQKYFTYAGNIVIIPISNFTAFLLLVKFTVALYDSSDDVVQLTSTSFDRLVSQSDNVWIIEFYAPWCKSEHFR